MSKLQNAQCLKQYCNTNNSIKLKCKQKLSELKKYENIIKKKHVNFYKKKVKPWDKKGVWQDYSKYIDIYIVR
jgi:hypothetical protein